MQNISIHFKHSVCIQIVSKTFDKYNSFWSILYFQHFSFNSFDNIAMQFHEKLYFVKLVLKCLVFLKW